MSRTDRQAPITLARLLGCEVVDESGRRCGHVHDVRLVRAEPPAEPDQAPRYRVEGLVVGTRGARARLGLTAVRRAGSVRASEPLRWEDVVALDRGRVTVRSAQPGR